jgi:choline dehydrogenase-like flavoprotein
MFRCEADLCIVGAGPAGITIAKAFAGTRHRVLLLESGGMTCEDPSQRLLEGASVGEPGLHPAHSRLRAFGGSCRLWGGGCLPLAPEDFEPRDWVPYSGWPIGYQDLEPYYRRALAVCGLHRHSITDGAFNTRARSFPRPHGHGDMANRVFVQSPVEFGAAAMEPLASAANVRVLLHANLIELHPVPSAEHVVEATISTLGGRRGTVRARHYVLAAGGIENARLLLLSDSLARGGLGNRHDLVGRFFQDHPRCRLGVLMEGRLDRVMHPFEKPTRRAYAEPCLSAEAQRAHQVLGSRIRPFAAHAAPPPGVQALRELRARLRGRSIKGVNGGRIEREVAAVLDRGLPLPLPPPDPEAVHPARTALQLVRHAGDVAGLALRKCRGGSHLRRERVELMGFFEQAPNPDSRISLDDRLDALGQRRVRVDWRLTDLDRATHRIAAKLFGAELARAHSGRFVADPWVDDPAVAPVLHGTAHHLGTTRMSADAHDGVVDRQCRVHGIDNLYVAGSSVFPTGGWAYPTFTIVALSLRLADHLRTRLDTFAPLIG